MYLIFVLFRNTGGLFDDFEDDSLFNTPVTPKPPSQPKQETKTNEIKPKKKDPEKKVEEAVVDDSEIIIKERKLGKHNYLKKKTMEK